MNEIELEFADYFVNMLREINPKVESADWYDSESGKKIEKLNKKQLNEITEVLVAQKWILKYKNSYLYEFNKEILPTIKKYGSYSNFYLKNENTLKRREQKENFDYGISKFQARTKLLPYFVSLASLAVAILTYFALSSQIQKQTQQKQIPKSEIITIVDSVLTSIHFEGDSLLNNSKSHDQ